MDNQFNFEGSPMPPKPEKPEKNRDGYATASLVLGIVALLIIIIVMIAAFATSGDPNLPTDQAMIEKMYRWIEKYAGKEAAR